MSTQRYRNTYPLITSLAVTLLAGCSSLSQQAAPVENANAAPLTGRVTSMPAASVATAQPVAVAQPLPYQSSDTPAATPVVTRPAAPLGEKTHVVKAGENLFRISLNNGLKYKDVANWNNLPDTNIKVGQVLRLTPSDSETAAASANTRQPAKVTPAASDKNTTNSNSKNYPKALKLPYSADANKTLAQQSEGTSSKKPMASAGKPATAATLEHGKPVSPAKKEASSGVVASGKKADDSTAKPAAEETLSWIWPTEGKVIRGYSENNKGVDLSGHSGQPVMAASEGKVVYSGNGLRGYGKLIIIKHNKTFLSAYAHNSQLLVKEGQSVKKGQKIAEMGNTDADQVKLHFEIRRFGKPVDPMQYLDHKS